MNTVVDHAADVVVDTVSPTIDSTPETTTTVEIVENTERSISLSRPAWT